MLLALNVFFMFRLFVIQVEVLPQKVGKYFAILVGGHFFFGELGCDVIHGLSAVEQYKESRFPKRNASIIYFHSQNTAKPRK